MNGKKPLTKNRQHFVLFNSLRFDTSDSNSAYLGSNLPSIWFQFSFDLVPVQLRLGSSSAQGVTKLATMAKRSDFERTFTRARDIYTQHRDYGDGMQIIP